MVSSSGKFLQIDSLWLSPFQMNDSEKRLTDKSGVPTHLSSYLLYACNTEQSSEGSKIPLGHWYSNYCGNQHSSSLSSCSFFSKHECTCTHVKDSREDSKLSLGHSTSGWVAIKPYIHPPWKLLSDGVQWDKAKEKHTETYTAVEKRQLTLNRS